LIIGTVSGLIQTTSGPVIGIFHKYAYHSQGKIIQEMDVYCYAMFTSDPSHFGDDDTIKVTDPVPTDPRVNQFGEGLGWEHSQVISNNDPDFDAICPYFGWTPLVCILQEMDVYHHAMFTSDMTWDPSHFGDDDTIKVTDPVPTDPRVNQFGEGLGWEHHETYSQVISKNYPDLDAMCTYFGWTPLVCI
jgi:hypothetical protein